MQLKIVIEIVILRQLEKKHGGKSVYLICLPSFDKQGG